MMKDGVFAGENHTQWVEIDSNSNRIRFETILTTVSTKLPSLSGASFMSFQQCVFNFGATPWKFPPKVLKVTRFSELSLPDLVEFV